MKMIPISCRTNWQEHIRENSYQSDVLSDPSQQYWVEALPTPFAIQFNHQEEQAIATATEHLWTMCVEFLDWFFTEDQVGAVHQRLTQLKIPQPYWRAMQASWERCYPTEDLSLYTRFDLAVTEKGQIKLLEINAETPLLGAETIYQWNWLVDYLHHHQDSPYPLPRDSKQFNDFWEQIADRWRRIVSDYNLKQTGISFLVDENLEEDLEMAMQLIQILHDEVDPDIYVQLVYLRTLKNDLGAEIQLGLGLDEEGYFVDHFNDRIPVLWKMYDWSDLQNDMENSGCTQILVNQLEQGTVKILEPLWKQILSNKGAMALMWLRFKNSSYCQYLLETYFEDNASIEVIQLRQETYVKKPFLGMEGVGISIETINGTLEKRESFGYGHEGSIFQKYIELPQALGYHYVIGSWSIDGSAAGVIIRGDRAKITGRHCLIIPHIVSDNAFPSLTSINEYR